MRPAWVPTCQPQLNLLPKPHFQIWKLVQNLYQQSWNSLNCSFKHGCKMYGIKYNTGSSKKELAEILKEVALSYTCDLDSGPSSAHQPESQASNETVRYCTKLDDDYICPKCRKLYLDEKFGLDVTNLHVVYFYVVVVLSLKTTWLVTMPLKAIGYVHSVKNRIVWLTDKVVLYRTDKLLRKLACLYLG